MPEASRWPWTAVEVISMPEVLVFDDVAWWTGVTSPFMGHINTCKS
jgi:hypothetical protein